MLNGSAFVLIMITVDTLKSQGGSSHLEADLISSLASLK